MIEEDSSKKHKELNYITQLHPNPPQINHNNKTNRTSLLQLTKEDKTTFFKTKLIILNNILKEYETWVNIILSIINDKSSSDNHINLGTPIQKGLEHIAKIQSDNLKLKQKLIDQITKNSQLEHQLSEMKTMEKWRVYDSKQCSSDMIVYEKKQLMHNLQLVANELDEQSEKNRCYKESMGKEENATYQNAMNEYVRLNDENLLLKQVIELRNEKNKLLYCKEEDEYEMNKGIGNSRNNRNEVIGDMNSMSSRCSMPMQYNINMNSNNISTTRRLGNYLLEGEEDWRDDTGLFTCKKL